MSTPFTAIIDPPAGRRSSPSAAFGARPSKTRDGGIVFRDVMTVTLTCDHRVVYGADGARFLSRLRELLERPARRSTL